MPTLGRVVSQDLWPLFDLVQGVLLVESVTRGKEYGRCYVSEEGRPLYWDNTAVWISLLVVRVSQCPPSPAPSFLLILRVN